MVDHPAYDPTNPATSWALNPWHPMSKPIDLKHLGKLAEELGEASEVLTEATRVIARSQAAIARCIIQGIDEREPVTHKPNREWLEDELADVLANIELVMTHFDLDRTRMEERVLRKMAYLSGSHSMLNEKP